MGMFDGVNQFGKDGSAALAKLDIDGINNLIEGAVALVKDLQLKVDLITDSVESVALNAKAITDNVKALQTEFDAKAESLMQFTKLFTPHV